MKKHLFLKSGGLLISLLLVACGPKNSSITESLSSESSTSHTVSDTQNSVDKNEKVTSSTDENLSSEKQESEELQKDTQPDMQPSTPSDTISNSMPDTQPNTSLEIPSKVTEKEYYDLIKEAWQKQIDYIESIDDSEVKQSVQTAHSAAIFKANELLLAHPEDSETIDASLANVLSGE